MRAPSHQRVPVVQQYAQSECGLCCAAMILGAWGRRSAIRHLRAEVDPGRDGLSLRDIAEILRGRGMQVSFFRATVAGVARIDTPVIAHWNNNHVVVVEKVTSRGAWIVDPAAGRRRVSLEELERSFSELVLVCTPTEAFEPGTEDSRSVWREVIGAVRSGTGRPMLAVGALSLVLYSVVLAVPMATERLVNGAGAEFLTGPASFQILVLSVPVLGYVLIAAVRSKILAALVATVGSSLMSATFGRLIALPYRYFATRSQGELMMRLSSVSQIRDMLSNQVTAALLDAGTLVVALLYVTQSSAGLGAVTIALIGVVVLVNTLTWGRLRRRTDQEITALAEASGVQMEAVSSIAAIKTSGMGERFYTNWRLRYASAVHHGRRRMELQGYVSALVSGVQIFGPFVILVVGLNMVMSGSADLGAVIASQALAATALGTTTSLTSTVAQFVQAQAQVQRMGDILLQPVEEKVFGTGAHEPRGAIAAEDLTFAYPGSSRPALQDVTFRAEPGERVAVVGSTGSGKSTLAKVLVGLYPASSGTIRLDGRPIRTVREADFRDGVAYVPQDVVLSNRSIAANIDFSAGEPDMERVREAAAQAHVLDTVLSMPLGFDTEIREMGANVSGGQRQRIALARALARRPRVLVMDEATSALDNATEHRVAQSLRELRCTQIIIAHRLSTIRDADRVVVMDEGRVVQTGTPHELGAVDGPYRRLVEHGAGEDETSGLDEWLSPSRPDLPNVVEDRTHPPGRPRRRTMDSTTTASNRHERQQATVPVIMARKLGRDFGDVRAVDGIDIDVHPGRVVGFLGPNGSGKSTTLRMMLGLLEPSSGGVTIHGVPYARLGSPLSTVGAALDGQAFASSRTGRQHLRCWAGLAGASHRRVEELLELVDLSGAAGRRIGTYSLGMKQRLSLATALLGDPQILVLDEPSNGLDPEGILWLRRTLRDLAREGRTVVVASHLLSEAQRMVDDVLLIRDGVVLYQGALTELLASVPAPEDGESDLEHAYLYLTRQREVAA